MTIGHMEKQLIAIGARIRDLRSKKGYSQEAFADSCGINRSHMGEVERGECNVTFATLLTITTKLEISISALLDGIA
ncbi:MAG: transcriptional regulator [Candidatus Angelobacter sp. Gp1-AA117]|nr:MAG: transcriptional regulator [Candidatus Angelobacter sp. Gp1-AA117]